ncbi:MAG: FtsX-like permease family protein [Candidatus Cloacimonetes bacterium]|nr:FtsX-like permease family protein [Candidatus Cloacimonadota bacterium]
MITKLAFRNIRGAGLRTWINVFILSIVYVTIIWFEGLYCGWVNQAENDMIDWEIGGGQVVVAGYDRFDPFSWDDAHAPLPASVEQLRVDGQAAAILVSSGVVYPQGRRQSVLLKGIDTRQRVLAIPTDSMAVTDGKVPIVLGQRMAHSLDVQQGDSFTMKWRTAGGAFDAGDVTVACIMRTTVPAVDTGQIWLSLEDLQRMKELPGEATYAVLAIKSEEPTTPDNWRWEDTDFLLSNLRAIMKSEAAGEYIIFAMLLFMAMIAIFDTQVLSLFHRRREMGTLLALGLTRRQLIRLFTLEGVLHAVLAIVMAAAWGTPLLWYFGTEGWKLPEFYDEYGMAGMSGTLIFDYSVGLVVRTIILVVFITTVVSWWPTRRIARLKPTDALRGKLS